MRGATGWSYRRGAGAPSDVLPQPMQEHGTTGNPHEKIPPPTRTCPRTEKPSMLCHIHALLKGSSNDLQARNRDVVTPVSLDGREQLANLQGTIKTTKKKNQPCLHLQLTGMPGATPRLCYGAGAPCTYPAAPECSMHKVHPGKVLSILTPASQLEQCLTGACCLAPPLG